MFLSEVGSGLAQICGIIWRDVPAKFKRGIREIKILGSEILCSVNCSGKIQDRDIRNENFRI